MKKNKKSPNIEKSGDADGSMDMYAFMKMPDYVYVPKNSKLIGKTVDEIKKEFCIDNIRSYDQITKGKDLIELESGMKLKSGYILIMGQWGGIKKFEETYDLKGNLRKTL